MQRQGTLKMLPKQKKLDKVGKQQYKQAFNKKLNELVTDKKITYIEATLEMCHETGMSEIQISKLINTSVRAKIQMEAEENNMIVKTGRLPL